MKINNRLNCISEYHFKKIENLKEKLINEGEKIFDFGIGDPDLPVPAPVIQSLIHGLSYEKFNNYPPYDGIKSLKLKLIKYYKEIFSVNLIEDEIVILIGSKEGINNIIPAICDFGDYAIIPQLGYSVYETCSNLWGVKTYKFLINEKNDYLPNLKFIPENIISESKLFFINYPNNPTGAIANPDFYKDIINFCIKNNIVVCNDSAYNEILKPGLAPISILQFSDNYKNNVVELGTFSKTFNMTGFRIGYAIGNREIINRLLRVKSNVDSGQFVPIQLSAQQALSIDREYISNMRNIYHERRVTIENLLKLHNIEFYSGKGTFYVWCKVPSNYTTDEFCEEVLENNGIIFTPGYVFGTTGYGYFRISLTKDCDTIIKAFNNVKIY